MRAILVLILAVAPGFSSAEENVAQALYPDEGRFELGLYPASVQLNGDLVSQVGTGVMSAWHFREGVAFQARFTHRAHSRLTADTVELMNLVRGAGWDEMAAEHQWLLMIGTEMAPFRGEGRWLNSDVTVELLLSGMGGVAMLQHRPLAPPGNNTPTSLSTGARPAMALAVGGRMKLGPHVSLRLELIDVFSSSRVSQVEGCTRLDLDAMEYGRYSGTGPGDVSVSAACNQELFAANPRSIPAASNLMRNRGSLPILHTLSVQLGAAVLF